MTVLKILYHKRNPVFTKTESETNSKRKHIFSNSRRKVIMILILVKNVNETRETCLRNTSEISQIIFWVCHTKNCFQNVMSMIS